MNENTVIFDWPLKQRVLCWIIGCILVMLEEVLKFLRRVTSFSGDGRQMENVLTSI